MLELLLLISSISNWHLTFRRQLLLSHCYQCWCTWAHLKLSVSIQLFRTKGIILDNICLFHFPWKFIYSTGNENINSFYQSLIIRLILLLRFLLSAVTLIVCISLSIANLITITIQCGHNALCSKSNLYFDFRKFRWSQPWASHQ